MAVSVTIDGVAYEPAGCSGVGVGITTHNRPDVLAKCIANVRRFTPGARIVVVDDASDTPPESDYRFDVNVGIARAKNKCIELLDGCDHIFLFDDDCWPIAEGWYVPYCESPEPHLMYVFSDFANRPGLNDTNVLYMDAQHVGYSHPRGCMLYVHSSVLPIVGGMDATFSKWGFEHGDWSNRIHAAGLTTMRYGDVRGSSALIHSMDEYREAESSVTHKDRIECGKANQIAHDERWDTPTYCEYRQMRDVVLTAYLTTKPDDQRNKTWKANPKDIAPLVKSCAPIVFTDELDCGIRITPCLSPYFERWVHEYRYLRDHPDIRYAWCVDATDVVMLHDPFPHMEPGVLYCGSEPKMLGIEWMLNNHEPLREWITDNATLTLLNSGIVGGDRATLMRLCHGIIREHANACINGKDMRFDMGPFNHVAYTGGFVIETGPRVHSLFRANDADADAWWKHK